MSIGRQAVNEGSNKMYTGSGGESAHIGNHLIIQLVDGKKPSKIRGKEKSSHPLTYEG
jgi:hypothetical protein